MKTSTLVNLLPVKGMVLHMTKQNEELSKIALETSGAQVIADRLSSISGGNVLDIATGNGDFIRLLMKTFRDYDSFIGIDMSKEELESARDRKDNIGIEFRQMTAEHLDFKNNSFDLVWNFSSLV